MVGGLRRRGKQPPAADKEDVRGFDEHEDLVLHDQMNQPITGGESAPARRDPDQRMGSTCGLGRAAPGISVLTEWLYRIADLIPGLSLVADVQPEQLERLQGFTILATTKFDAGTPDHKRALRDYWDICQAELKPGVSPAEAITDDAWEVSHASKQWEMFGFQGTDPATDFRGGGVFSLHNLLWFAGAEPDSFAQLMGKTMTVKHALPFSIAGINLTMMLLHILQLTPSRKTCFDSAQASTHANSQSIVKLARRNFVMFLIDAGMASQAAVGDACDVRAVEAAFNRVYSVAFLMLAALWEDSAKNIMEFNLVLARCRKAVELLLMNSASLDDFCHAAAAK